MIHTLCNWCVIRYINKHGTEMLLTLFPPFPCPAASLPSPAVCPVPYAPPLMPCSSPSRLSASLDSLACFAAHSIPRDAQLRACLWSGGLCSVEQKVLPVGKPWNTTGLSQALSPGEGTGAGLSLLYCNVELLKGKLVQEAMSPGIRTPLSQDISGT